MNESEALSRMISPGMKRAGKPRGGVIQIHVTRACNLACFNCTQGSNLAGKPTFISLDHFEQACESLAGYWGIVGVFGGNPAMHPQFDGLCQILAKYIPREQRGLWCNAPMGRGASMRETFNPAVSNLNVHLDREAHEEFLRDWPESRPFGLKEDSRHSPVYVAMRDVLKIPCPVCNGQGSTPNTYEPDPCHHCRETGKLYDESAAWELISNCDINRHWSAMVGEFRGELRAWFCEIAGAQSILHQDEPDYPDTGLRVDRLYDDGEKRWWELPMHSFVGQVRKHCHDCGVPMRGYGELAQARDGVEQTSETHAGIYRPKRAGRRVELVTVREQLGKPLDRMTDYLGNSRR